MAYGYKRAITIAGATNTTQTNFPVLVKFDSSNVGTTFKTVGNGGRIQNTVTQSGGNAVTMPADLIITSDSAGLSMIPWEVAYYDGTTNGVLWIWVLIASLTTSGTTIYVSYGDAAVTTQQNTSSFAVSAVWNSNYKLVQHLSDPATLRLADSTSNAITLTNNNGVTTTTGNLSGAASLASASSQSLSTTTDTASVAMSYECWFKPASFPNSYNTIMGGNTTRFFDMHVKSTGKLAMYLASSSTVNYDGTGSNTLVAGNWYHLCMVYSSLVGLKGYVNGGLDGSAAANGNIATSYSYFSVGNDPIFNPRYINGLVAEARISNTALTADWVATSYANQSAPLTFSSVGSEVLLGAVFIASRPLVIAQGVNRAGTY